MTRNVHLILAVIFVVFGVQTMVSLLVPLVASDSGVPEAIIGVLVAIPLGIGMVVDIPIARASDMIGRRPALMGGAAVGVLAAAILGIGQGVAHLAVGSLLFGLSLSLMIGPSLALVTEVSDPKEHGRVQGINGAIQGLSALLAAASVGVLMATYGGPTAFAAVALLVGASAAFILPIQERSRRSAEIRYPSWRRFGGAHLALVGAYRRALSLLVAEPALLIAAGAASLYGLVFLVVGNAFVPIYLVGSGQYSSSDAVGMLALRSIVAAGVSLLFASVVTRTGIVPLILASNVLGITGVGLVPILADSDSLIVAFVMQGAGVAFGPASNNMLIASATTESDRAIGFSATMLAARVSGSFLPIALGLTATLGGYASMFILTVLMGLSLVATMALVARRASAQGRPISHHRRGVSHSGHS